ncbi:MAG: AMP-binding protein, partial [Streptosporangiales bacterium]
MNLHELVTEAAAQYPDRVAVAGPGGPVCYGELDRAANGLAGRLIELGASHGDRIVVWDDKSAAAIAA